MGWGSASQIFDPIAQVLIDLDADEETKRRVLGSLIDKLRDGDWDTCDESMREFRGDPVIHMIFRERGIGNYIWSADGRIGGTLALEGDYWILECDEHRHLAMEPSTIAGHDALVAQWAAHCAECHGGDGKVDEDLLINRPAPEPVRKPMTVAALRDLLAGMPDDQIVVMSKDSEGNRFSPLAKITQGFYAPESSCTGEFYDVNEDPDGEPDDDDAPAVCLWPTS